MSKTLTAVAISKLRPGASRREIPDAGMRGLYLIVQPVTGAKSWAMRFRRPDGTPAKVTLGPCSLDAAVGEPVVGQPLTLASARRLAAAIQQQRAMGADVVADLTSAKARQRSQQEQRSASTFGAAARDFVEGYVMRKLRRWPEQARLLGFRPAAGGGVEIIDNGLADRWSNKPLADIDGHLIHALIDEARLRGVPGLERRTDGVSESMGRMLYSCLSKLFSWLQQKRRIERNPVTGVFKPEAPKARDRVLTAAEIVAFWKATDQERFGPALKLLLLTGARLNEVVGMRRSELVGNVWTLPGARTKNHLPHVVPLPAMAVALIPDGPIDVVFTTNGRTPVSGWSNTKERLDAAMRIPPWRLHDLRRTCATGMAELGIAPHIVEAVLNHVSGARAGVAGIYNRAAYQPEKTAALERWAEHVSGLISGRAGKIVPLRGRKP